MTHTGSSEMPFFSENSQVALMEFLKISKRMWCR